MKTTQINLPAPMTSLYAHKYDTGDLHIIASL